tara:strand:+ start:264 stop:626 length:363 start_codon:yes stop_codon:yes gene_type:complete
MNSSQFGCFAEYLFAVEAMKNDLMISFPLLHTSVYDCIIDSPNGLYKIQIKAINEGNRTRERIRLSDRNQNRYKTTDVDFFAIYSKQRNGFFIIKNDGVLKSFTLGMKKYSNNFNNFALL